MLVYGERERQVDGREEAEVIAATLRHLALDADGLERHARLVEAFIGLAALVTGLIDRDGDAAEIARSGPAVLTALAQQVLESWHGRVQEPGGVPLQIAAMGASGPVTVKLAEGFQHYAVYPESYGVAAAAAGLPPTTRVIGIRSIGTALAAMVTAGLGAAPPVTVRPTGHPFARTLDAGAGLTEALLAGTPEAFAVVDEGPGLSGSSIAAVVNWLRTHGVPAERITVFASHGNGPGRAASDEVRAVWATTTVRVADFAVAPGVERLAAWATECVGPLTAPLQDVSGGAWRHVTGAEAAVAPGGERRKFIAETEAGRFLLKFAGLGAAGTLALDRARRLAEAGFGPVPVGLCHGFLGTEWCAGAALQPTDRPVALLPTLARYLRLRAGWPAGHDDGARPARLLEMAVHNTRVALGDETAQALERRLRAALPVAVPQRVVVDGRMQSWEWLRAGDRLIKTDGLDHADGHDLVGAQPIDWDVAGALVEFQLDGNETTHLLRLAPLARELDFYLPCYLAFQTGLWTMANGPDDAAATRYRERLAAWVRSGSAPS